MRLSTTDLRNALRVVAPAISPRPAMPILAGVTITSTADGLAFAATDFETWVRTSVSADSDGVKPFAATVSHRVLSTIAKVAKASVVTLSAYGNTLTVQSGSASWTAPLMAAPEFAWPKMPAEFGQLDAATMRTLVRTTVDAAGPDATIAALLPLHIVTIGNRLSLGATDRVQMRVAEAEFKPTGSSDVSAYPMARTIGKLAEHLTGTVTLHADGDASMFAVSDDTTCVLVRTIAEKVPDLAAYVANINGTANTTLLTNDLADAIRAVAPMVAAKGGVRLTVTDGSLTAEGASADGGGTVPVDCSHEGRGLIIMVNPGYLLGALDALACEQVQLYWTKPTGAMMVRPAGSTDAAAVIMAIRDDASTWLGDAS